jgi:hypothetical protein
MLMAEPVPEKALMDTPPCTLWPVAIGIGSEFAGIEYALTMWSPGSLVPPNSTVSVAAAFVTLLAQRYNSSNAAVPETAVWRVVPGVDVAATTMGRPFVLPESGFPL